MSTDNSLKHSRSRGGGGEPTERVTVRLRGSRLDEIDVLVERGEYGNRSCAIRSLLQKGLEARDSDD